MLTKCGKCVYTRQREKQPTTSGSGSHSGSAQSTVAAGDEGGRSTTTGKRGAARAVAQQRKRKESVVSVLSAPTGLEPAGSTTSGGRLRKKSATTLIGTSDEVADEDAGQGAGGYRKFKSHGQKKKCKSLSISLDLASDHDLFG